MVESSEILKQVNTKILTPDIYCYTYIDSTNRIAKELLEKGAREGTIVVADEQYGGKGRHDRVWWSPLGGLYMSLIIDMKTTLEETPLLGLLAGCAVVESIEQMVGLKPQLKWPNDIMLNEKKLGGILCELVERNENEFSVIIGIGVNQNIVFDEIPSELRDSTTTIEHEAKGKTSCEQLIALIINGIDTRLSREGSNSSLKFIIQEWIQVTNTIGQDIEVVTDEGKIIGKAIGISEIGSLLLSTEAGTIELRTGDVIHVGVKR